MSRRPSVSLELALRWLLAAAAAGCSPSSATPPAELSRPADRAETTDGASGYPVVRSLALTVSDLDRSIELFRALDFRLEDQHYARGAGFAAWAGLAGAEMRQPGNRGAARA